MQYEDRVTIQTPEGVDLELTLAGIGSRFTSAIVDAIIQTVLVVALVVIFGVSGLLGGYGLAIFFVLSFLLFAGYDIGFEVLASGRTPGKRLNGLRVVRDDGSPVTFLTSAVRNILRLIDFLPTGYLIGIVSILVTSRNKRLGDIAAGTLVVRERRAAESRGVLQAIAADARQRPPGTEPAAWTTWDVSGISSEELVAVRRFLDRRDELTFEARGQLATELAGALRHKVVGVPDQVRGEAFLELLAAAKSVRG
jgi:uncharacterized RDD family membrane protein YckC